MSKGQSKEVLMDEQRIEVSTQVVGEADQSFKMMPVWIEVVEETPTVEELIASTVERQVTELLGGREIDLEKARRILNRQYMSQEDIESQLLKSGQIQYPSERSIEVLEKEFDVSAETERALKAFESGRVIVFIDGQQVHDLDEEVTITPETKVKFLRLTPLVGG